MNKNLICALVLGLAGFGCASDPVDPGLGESEAPCGIVACEEGTDTMIPDWDGDPEADLGKFDRESVEDAISLAAGDGVLDSDDIRDAFEAAGNRVGKGEMRAIRQALDSTDFEVTDGARETALELAYVANLFDYEVETLQSGFSYAGTEVPAAVRRIVAIARLNGATAYDVQERDDDGEGVWNPYPATTPPVENMTFEYTEVSPAALTADMEATDLVYNAIVGTETAEYCDDAGNCRDYQRARLEERTGGTGNVRSHYDEVYHADIYARGRSGQQWANNCAILSDGSLHCLPAARRSIVQDVILTNPHLSRCNPYTGFEEGCKHMLYHGHIDIDGGVVVGVEMSGRLSKRAAKGKASFIDPLAVLEAWGFEIADGVRIRYGNTEDGTPTRDLEGHILTEAESAP